MMRQLALPLPHDAAMGADDFLVTPCNSEAAAWIEKWPDWPAPGLVVTGLPGSGKTHLVNLWLARSGGRLVSPLDLRNIAPADLTTTTTALALDDVDAFAADAEGEEKLFHLFNHIKSAGGSLLLALTRPVAATGFALPDLRSRLLTLPVAALGAPDDALLEALIVKQFRDRQVSLDVGVVSYLATRIDRDAASIRALVERLDRTALAEGRKITVSLARKTLEETHG